MLHLGDEYGVPVGGEVLRLDPEPLPLSEELAHVALDGVSGKRSTAIAARGIRDVRRKEIAYGAEK